MSGTEPAVLVAAPKTLIVPGYGDGRNLKGIFAWVDLGSDEKRFIAACAAVEPLAGPGDAQFGYLQLDGSRMRESVLLAFKEQGVDQPTMEDIGRFAEEYPNEQVDGPIIGLYADLPSTPQPKELQLSGGSFNLIHHAGGPGNCYVWMPPHMAKHTTFHPNARYLYRKRKQD